MRRLRRQHQGGAHAADLAPLVDIALILVVFLLLTSQMVTGQQIPVQLVQTTHGDTQEVASVTFSLTRDGHLWVADEQIVLTDVKNYISSKDRAVLRIDAACEHRHVVHLVDSLRALGVHSIVEATHEKKDTVETW